MTSLRKTLFLSALLAILAALAQRSSAAEQAPVLIKITLMKSTEAGKIPGKYAAFAVTLDVEAAADCDLQGAERQVWGEGTNRCVVTSRAPGIAGLANIKRVGTTLFQISLAGKSTTVQAPFSKGERFILGDLEGGVWAKPVSMIRGR